MSNKLRFITTVIAMVALTASCANLPAPMSSASSSTTVQRVDDNDALISIIHAIAQGWEQADGQPFREHYLDVEGARYIESGGQNDGLTDLIEHHVEPEGDALADLDLTFSNIETHIENQFAWAIADVELTAKVRRDNRSLHVRGFETFLFRQVEGDWKVVHTHSSTRPVKD